MLFNLVLLTYNFMPSFLLPIDKVRLHYISISFVIKCATALARNSITDNKERGAFTMETAR